MNTKNCFMAHICGGDLMVSMNEWMNVYLYTAHIMYCLKAVYNSNCMSEIERQLVEAPLAAAIS